MLLNRVPIEELKPIAGRSRRKMTTTLRAWGLPALPDIDGWPIVLRSDLERVHGLPEASRTVRKRPRLGAATM